jgi:hypothetical protein
MDSNEKINSTEYIDSNEETNTTDKPYEGTGIDIPYSMDHIYGTKLRDSEKKISKFDQIKQIIDKKDIVDKTIINARKFSFILNDLHIKRKEPLDFYDILLNINFLNRYLIMFQAIKDNRSFSYNTENLDIIMDNLQYCINELEKDLSDMLEERKNKTQKGGKNRTKCKNRKSRKNRKSKKRV